jgi:hypothetical protein
MGRYFVLNDLGEPVRERDLEAWSRWFERADRRIARTVVTPDVTVLTTFRGVDEADEADEAPVLFETRIFGGVLNGEEAASRTKSDALDAHAGLVEWCRIGNAPGAGITEDQLR